MLANGRDSVEELILRVEAAIMRIVYLITRKWLYIKHLHLKYL
jgi:hypothetical protein